MYKHTHTYLYVQGCRGDKEVNLREGYILFLRIILILTTFLKARKYFPKMVNKKKVYHWTNNYNTITELSPLLLTSHLEY